MEIFTHSPLLGTVVELRVDAEPAAAEAADAAAIAEFERLTEVFSTHAPNSELRRWSRGEVDLISTDLRTVLAASEVAHRRSGGAFHPATGAVRQLWLHAEQTGLMPSADRLAAVAGRPLPYRVSEGRVERLGDCSGLDLNAIAKGYIVDRAVAAALVPGVDAVLVNAGGDLRHAGSGSVRVGIEDPARPFDNAPPRWRVELTNAALATSGTARRGFRVGERWLGHVLDPRSGWPVEHTASISVLADDAMTADALATVLGVLPRTEAMAFADRESVACLLVDSDGSAYTSPSWPN